MSGTTVSAFAGTHSGGVCVTINLKKTAFQGVGSVLRSFNALQVKLTYMLRGFLSLQEAFDSPLLWPALLEDPRDGRIFILIFDFWSPPCLTLTSQSSV